MALAKGLSWGIFALLHAGLIGWMAASLWTDVPPSDDALFFSRGLVHFSVLEFSPHFPGYPGFIALGRLLLPFSDTPLHALGGLSMGVAALLPVVLAWTISRLGGRAFFGYALGLGMPLLPCLGVSWLSDGCGLLFFALGVAAIAKPSPVAHGWVAWGWGGLAWGMALICRPSYGVMVAVLGLFCLIWGGSDAAWDHSSKGRWRRRWALVLGGCAVVLPAFGLVLAWEGGAYVEEGRRFLIGHTTLWGHTAWSPSDGDPSWADSLTNLPGGRVWAASLAGLLIVWSLWSLARHSLQSLSIRIGLLVTVSVVLVWALLMQNPDNPRHLAPVVLLALMCLGSASSEGGLWRAVLGLLAVGQVGITVASLALPAQSVLLSNGNWADLDGSWARPPLANVVQSVREMVPPPSLVVTNRGVFTLRAMLPQIRVADAYYGADAASLVRTVGQGGAVLVRSRPLPSDRSGAAGDWLLLHTYPARCWGEASLWVYGQSAPQPAKVVMQTDLVPRP